MTYDPFKRRPLSPAEFDDRCRRLEELHPTLSLISGRREPGRNEEVGGGPESKHLVGMARDYDLGPNPSDTLAKLVAADAKTLGLWTEPYTTSVHVQGLPTGSIPAWWREHWGPWR